MKIFKNIVIVLFLLAFASSCILEKVEPEYNVVGAVGTIATLTSSTTTPTVGQTVTFTLTVYSEHENAKELRMNRVVGSTVTNLQTKTFTSWNKENSYVETFTFQVPQGTAGTPVVIQFALITESGYAVTRNVTLNVRAS